ncbi:MAG: hypothetical protein IJL18_05130 [Synergistaceae bacterium]|nr:hypothetical protein [Synergistaceae bacterium]
MARLIMNGDLAVREGVNYMASKKKSRKKKTARKFPRMDILAATLYWLIRLAILLWDRFIG